MTDDRTARVEIRLPLPLDLVSTIGNLLNAAYPGTEIAPSEYNNLILMVPLSARAKRLTKAQVNEAKEAAASEDDEIELTHFAPNNIRMTIPESLALPMAQMVKDLFIENPEAENYLEMPVRDRDDPSIVYLVTACKSKGRTPHDLRRKAEAERDAALTRVAELESTA